MMDTIIKCIKDQYWKKLKKKANVIGYSNTLKPKIVNGKEVKGTKVFRIYVEKKEVNIACKDMIPKNLEITDKCECGISTIETDIVAIGKIKYKDGSLTDPAKHQQKIRPYIAGTSTDHWRSTACTGNVPFKRLVATGVTNDPIYTVFISGNNHCFGMENDALDGDLVIQPSAYDGGNIVNDCIAKFAFGIETKFQEFTCPYRNFFMKLYKSIFKVTKFKSLENVNTVDIAFALPNNVNDISYGVFGVNGRIVTKGVHDEGTEVIKSGRTTGVTVGKIIDSDWSGIVEGRRGKALYDDCVLCALICDGGDSGSPVVSKTNTGDLAYQGALFAGSDTTSVYCKWENIEKLSGLEVITY